MPLIGDLVDIGACSGTMPETRLSTSFCIWWTKPTLAKTPAKVTMPMATRTLEIVDEDDFSTLLYCTPDIFNNLRISFYSEERERERKQSVSRHSVFLKMPNTAGRKIFSPTHHAHRVKKKTSHSQKGKKSR